MYEYFWLSYLLCMLIPALALLAGFVMWKYTPTRIHSFIGFRTTRAMQDGATWRFANEYAGRLLVRTSLGSLAVSAVVPFFFMHGDNAVFQALTLSLSIAQVALIVVSLVAAQIALVRRFPDRKSSGRR